jgi:putative acetyltransferase
MAFRIQREDPAQPDVMKLLEDGETYAAALYPAESNHFFSVEELKSDNVRFFVARDDTGAAVGTGAVVLHNDWAEVKRMWVSPNARGQRISWALLSRLEAEAIAAGLAVLRLETGVENHEALGLYSRAGFKVRGPFAQYSLDPLSIFMEKLLA